jgi:type VI secretion system (T6SS) phospholipase Tle1-like effector
VDRFAGLAFGSGEDDILEDAEMDVSWAEMNNDYTLDIVGFSRGGIEAVEFANRIHDAYPDEVIRVVGLYDPVGSFGHPGGFGGNRITLPPGVVHSAEAMAQDEHRKWFPATDVNVTVHKWFRGEHSDIGGGFWNHDIADAVLDWMTEQASSAGVQLDLTGVKAKVRLEPEP